MRQIRPRNLVPLTAALILSITAGVMGSSHREAPLISADPQADNTDLYAFRSPDDTNTITIIANYIPLELPEGGPNYATFGEGIHYEIHVDNNAATNRDDISYRFTFTTTNEDPTTFFNIRLGKQNLKTTWKCEKSTDFGGTWTTLKEGGVVPPNNIGPRSIEGGAGLNTTYEQLFNNAITNLPTGETIYCGPVDDPFFVDLGGIFDLGQTRSKNGTGADRARDGVAGFNCHTIAMKIPISHLQKDQKTVAQAVNILDPDFVIGVWASASRPRVTTLSPTGEKPTYSDDYVQVSRLGMPLTNEAVIPIGMKDKWNATSPYDTPNELSFAPYFVNPELALYMDDSQFGGAVPAFAALRIQSASLGGFDFRNTKNGLSGLDSASRAGTVFADPTFGPILLQAGNPRSVDILPAFYTGVPNVRPYQLATGKAGNPLAEGKPFINNFLPSLGDMLRLNMAVPITPRTSAAFSSDGIVAAAVLGLTDPAYSATATLQWIPNMDGFPNGRRLEDDVTRIELQAVSGVVLAAIGLWYDDYQAGGSPVTPKLLGVLGYTTGVEENDLPFRTTWPYMALPHRGYDYNKKLTTSTVRDEDPMGSTLNMTSPAGFFNRATPNPATGSTRLDFHLANGGHVTVRLYDARGNEVTSLYEGRLERGDHNVEWRPDASVPAGAYLVRLSVNNAPIASTKVTLIR